MSTGERTSETAVLTKQERERGLEKEPVNVGEPPIYSRKGVGSRERYDFCEDRKINDPNHGLFMVADGVSGSTGKVGTGEKASDMLARIVQQSLGAELDQELSVLARHPDMSDLQKAEKMSAEVNAKMRAALGLADHRIHTLQELNPLNKEAATTSTLAKIVDLPTGEKRLFLANIGDSRAFILRAGKLYRLTQDDSYASFILRSKLDLLKPKGTPQEIAERKQEFSRQMRLLEQAEGPDQLPANIRELYRFRNMITAAVGNGMHANDPGGNGESVRIESFVLEKGDRLMLASDGVTDQLLETEIEKITGAHTDDKQAERAIQEFADNVSLANDRPRAKADDISMVVHTVWQEKKPSMTDAPEQDKVKMEGDRNVSEVTNEQKQQWVERLRQLDQDIRRQRAVVESAKQHPNNQRVTEQIKLQTLESQNAQLDYALAKAQFDQINRELPLRYNSGEQVVFNGKTVTVENVDTKTGRYTLLVDAKQGTVDRFELEIQQEDLPIRAGDVLPVRRSSGEIQDGWTVLMKQNGRVVVSLGQGTQRPVYKDVEQTIIHDALLFRLTGARDARERMNRATINYRDALTKKEKFETQKAVLDQRATVGRITEAPTVEV